MGMCNSKWERVKFSSPHPHAPTLIHCSQFTMTTSRIYYSFFQQEPRLQQIYKGEPCQCFPSFSCNQSNKVSYLIPESYTVFGRHQEEVVPTGVVSEEKEQLFSLMKASTNQWKQNKKRQPTSSKMKGKLVQQCESFIIVSFCFCFQSLLKSVNVLKIRRSKFSTSGQGIIFG